MLPTAPVAKRSEHRKRWGSRAANLRLDPVQLVEHLEAPFQGLRAPSRRPALVSVFLLFTHD